MRLEICVVADEFFDQPYPGVFYTGDGAARDEDGYVWIKGRIDGEIILSSGRW